MPLGGRSGLVLPSTRPGWGGGRDFYPRYVPSWGEVCVLESLHVGACCPEFIVFVSLQPGIDRAMARPPDDPLARGFADFGANANRCQLSSDIQLGPAQILFRPSPQTAPPRPVSLMVTSGLVVTAGWPEHVCTRGRRPPLVWLTFLFPTCDESRLACCRASDQRCCLREPRVVRCAQVRA